MKILNVVKKPIAVQAMQFDGENHDALRDFANQKEEIVNFFEDNIQVRTLEGTMSGAIGDYLVKGIRGEFYICEKSIFEESYIDATPQTIHTRQAEDIEDALTEILFYRAGYIYVRGRGWDQISAVDIRKSYYLMIADRNSIWNGKSQSRQFGIGICTLRRDLTTPLKKGAFNFYPAKDVNGKEVEYGLLDDGSHFYICRLNKL